MGFYPKHFRNYLFGDHREYDPEYWNAYYGGRPYHGSYHGPTEAFHGEANLDDQGVVTLGLRVPTLGYFPAPRKLTLSTEVLDKNQQTLSSSAESTVHPASFYLGVERQDRLLREKVLHEWGAIPVNADGQLRQEPVEVKMRLKRKVWETVKVKLAGGGVSHRNESRTELVEERDLIIDGEQNRFSLQFPSSGTFILTLTAKDEEGRLVKTADAIRCLWARPTTHGGVSMESRSIC